MPQSLTSITNGSCLAVIDCSDGTLGDARTTDLLFRPCGFALDGTCAAAYAYDMFGRFQYGSRFVLPPAAPCSVGECFESGKQEIRKGTLVSPGTPKPATSGHPKPATCGHPKTSHLV